MPLRTLTQVINQKADYSTADCDGPSHWKANTRAMYAWVVWYLTFGIIFWLTRLRFIYGTGELNVTKMQKPCQYLQHEETLQCWSGDLPEIANGTSPMNRTTAETFPPIYKWSFSELGNQKKFAPSWRFHSALSFLVAPFVILKQKTKALLNPNAGIYIFW